jgi:hypothetical protein
VVHVLLPFVALGIARTAGWVDVQTSRTAYTVASATGLGLAVVLAAAPSLAVPVAVALLVVLRLARRGRLLLLWTVAVAGMLLLPWWRAVVEAPALLAAGPDLPAAGGGPGGENPWWALGALPGAPEDLLGGPAGAPARWLVRYVPAAEPWLGTIAGAVAVAAVVPAVLLGLRTLLRRGASASRTRAVLLVWLLGLGGLGVALVAARTEIAATPDGGAFGWSGPGTSLFLLAALTAATAGLTGAGGRLRRRVGHRRLRLTGAGLVAVVVTALPLLTLGTWAWTAAADGTAGPDGRGLVAGDPDVLPDVAAVEARSVLAQRTLVLQVREDGVQWSLARDAGPRLADSSAVLAYAELSGTRTEDDADVVVPVIADLLADSGRDLRPAWQDLAVASVLLLAPLDESAALAIDASPGLVRSGTPAGGVLWRVEPGTPAGETAGETAGAAVDSAEERESLAARRGARVRVLSEDGEVLAAVASAVPESGMDVTGRIDDGPQGRVLVLAERADPGWQAFLDGRRLSAQVHSDWAQAFALPADGGRLVVRYREPWQVVSDVGRLVVAIVAGLLALPLPRLKRQRVSPPRHSQPVGRRVIEKPSGTVGVAGAPLGTPEAMDAWLAATRARLQAEASAEASGEGAAVPGDQSGGAADPAVGGRADGEPDLDVRERPRVAADAGAAGPQGRS